MSRFFLIVYDIPQNSGVPNPSGYFRQFGVRINLSCWIMPESAIPYPYLREMHRQGVRWEAVAFDPRENANLTRMAIQGIQDDIAGLRRRTAATCERAARHAEGTTNADTLKAFRKTTATSLKKMRKALADLRKVAQRFGVEVDFDTAEGYVDSIKNLMLRRASTLVETVRALETNNPNDPVARQLRDNTIDPAIAADYFADTVQTSEGWHKSQTLRNAFSGYDNWFS